MSVTFNPVVGDDAIIGYRLYWYLWSDEDNEYTKGELDVNSLEEADFAMLSFPKGTEFLVDPIYVFGELPEVQMANTNARHILLLLELDDFELCGVEETPKFLARTLYTLSQDLLDEGTPTIREGNSVFFGREAGYDTEKLTALHNMALWAQENGISKISWS